MPDPNPAEVFSEIFEEGLWRGSVPSGPGSSLRATALLRPQLQSLFSELGIRSLCDAPCGDGTWITEITDFLDLYVGVDVVPALINNNRARGLPANHRFEVADVIADPLPSCDAIFCRDCLVHLPLSSAIRAIENFKNSGATYLICTTFPGWPQNIEARMGTWRPLDLNRIPFSFPEPLRLIRERAPNPVDKYNSKSMGVWRLVDLPVTDVASGTANI